MRKTFHTPLLTTILTILLIFSCKKEVITTTSNTCNVSNPVEDLPWLKARINSILVNPDAARYQYVSIADYNSQTIFIFGNCDPLALTVAPAYSCSGTFLGNIGDLPPVNIKNQKPLWKASNSVCNP
jgi:hypothetical protein